MKKVLLFGATGSIGKSTLEILRKYPEKFSLVGITARTRVKELRKIAEEFKAPYLVVEKEEDAKNLKKSLTYRAEVLWGEKGLEELASLEGADLSVIGISGIIGLIPSYFSLKTAKTVAIANKESLIVAGHLLKNEARKTNRTSRGRHPHETPVPRGLLLCNHHGSVPGHLLFY